MQAKTLNWATSKTIGRISEIAVLSPVREGIVPGERRTYEERLRDVISDIARRHAEGLPIELSRISTIHFGRMIIIRPEQYLLYSNLAPNLVRYDTETTTPQTPSVGTNSRQPAPDGVASSASDAVQDLKVPQQFDDFRRTALPLEGRVAGKETAAAPPLCLPPPSRTLLLTLVEFDGDLRVYMREIAEFIGRDFDNVFENCENYPATANFERFWEWIRRYQLNTDLFYAPYSNLTATRIRQLEDFKNKFDEFVARVRPSGQPPVVEMDQLFDDFLRRTQQYPSGFPSPGGLFPPDVGLRRS